MTQEQKDAMCSEITNASVGVWDKTLKYCEDGIKLEKLWEILDKYIKVE